MKWYGVYTIIFITTEMSMAMNYITLKFMSQIFCDSQQTDEIHEILEPCSSYVVVNYVDVYVHLTVMHVLKSVNIIFIDCVNP